MNSTKYKQTIEKEKIITYWKTLFPEKNRSEQLELMLEKISGKNTEYFLTNYGKNEKLLDEIENSFSSMIDNKYSKLLDNILIKQKERTRWAFFFKPVLSLHIEQLIKLIDTSSILENKEHFLEVFISTIVNKLIILSYRTIILETNIAKNDECLQGETSIERGKYYTDTLLKDIDYLKEIYLVYPELYKVMKRTVLYSINYLEEILSNTNNNLSEIEKTFNHSKSLGKIQNIIFGNGDSHNNGKTVVTIKFKDKVLVYKPRNFSLEISYEKFLKWVNNKIPGFSPLRYCKTYSVKNAGWMEFIENTECNSINEISEFYLKMGELLCLFYTLNSKDCHCENIIANGKYPILIDLETILHTDEDDKNKQFDSIEEYINSYIQNSVYSILILPSLLQNFNTNEVMEIGAIGSGKVKKSPFKTQKITNFDQDNISIENEYKEVSDAGNYPIFNGDKVGGNGYIDYVKRGFVNTYQWILNNKKEYLNKVVELFSTAECRVIYKATNDYTQLISTSYHPNLLQNKVDRTIYFHRIGILVKDYENFNKQKLYQTEIEAMLNGDIPSFKINANSKNATNYKNEIIYSNYKKSILETIENKIQNLNSIDLERQVALIYLSYIGCKMKIDLPNKTETKFFNCKSDLNFNYLNEACSIGKKAIERSFSANVNNKKENSWLCYIGFGNDYYSINPVGWDLYKGNSGMALFFMYLGKSSKEEKYIQFAKDTLNSVNRFMTAKDSNDIETIGFGAFTGMYSYVYTLYKFIEFDVYTKFEINRSWNNIYKILDLTNRKIESEENLDVIGGISGIMGVLVTIYESVNENYKKVITEILLKIINILKQKCIYISPDEISWTDNEDIGYAHGNAGIICHLARSYKILQNYEILDLIHKALNYERKTQFNKENNMWMIRKNTHYYSWCNGIAGLILTKLVLLQTNIEDEKLIDEIKLLIIQLKEYGFGNDYSICHGDIGSVYILKYAAKFINDEQLKKQCTSTLDNFIHNYLKKQKDHLYTLEDWGIMTGKSGIGMGLLDEFNEKNLIVDVLLLK